MFVRHFDLKQPLARPLTGLQHSPQHDSELRGARIVAGIARTTARLAWMFAGSSVTLLLQWLAE